MRRGEQELNGLELFSRPFLGWERGFIRPGRRGWVVGTEEDMVAVLGVPRVGKTGGLLVPQALLWRGPAVIASSKWDLLRATGDRRAAIAARSGGGVSLYAPVLGRELHFGLRSMAYSLVDASRTPKGAKAIASAMIRAGESGKGITDASYWSGGGIRILQCLLHAAAVAGTDIRQVQRWIGRGTLDEPAKLLEDSSSPAAEQWSADLRDQNSLNERERASFFGQARAALAALDLPEVVANSCHSDLTADDFLLSGSTLYIVNSGAEQQEVAPLIAGFVEALVARAYELWNLGRLPERLLLLLDEVANIVPLPMLARHMSEGAGQGVLIYFALQDWSQLRHKYGDQVADAIFSLARAKILFGGSDNERELSRIERLLGTHHVERPTSETRQQDGGRSHSRSWEREARISTAELRAIPPGRALLVYHTYAPELVEAKIAARTKPFHRHVGWLGVRPEEAWPVGLEYRQHSGVGA